MSERTEGAKSDAPSDRVLVPVRVLEGESLAPGVAELLAPLSVLVLGYHELPEQTPPGQARQQFQERAQGALADLVGPFGDAETRLVFTNDAEQTIDRVAAEEGCAAVLLPNPIASVDSLLVAVHGDVDVDRLAGFAAALRADRDVDLTAFAAARDGTELSTGPLEGVRDRLLAAGVPADAVTTRTATGETPAHAIAAAAIDHDAVVLGERSPSWRDLVFGDPTDQVAAESVGPVVVVRRQD